MDAAILATLRELVPRVLLHPAKPTTFRPFDLGAVVGARVRGSALVVTLGEGVELGFHLGEDAWRVIAESLRTGALHLDLDDPARALRQLGALLGTLRDHLDA